MYYYLFEEPKSLVLQQSHRKVLQVTSDLGITGQSATPSEAHPITELVEAALRKGFSTIVAVGSDTFIAEVASELLGTEVAFGIIPVGEAPLFSELVGVKSISEAGDVLKKRKVRSVGVGVIDPRKYFLTQAEVSADKSTPITIESGQFRLQGTFTNLILTANPQDGNEAGLTVRFLDRTRGYHPVVKLFHWLVGKRALDSTFTRIISRKITLTTPSAIPVLTLGKEIAKLPLRARYIPDALKIVAPLSGKELR
jgi:diacylglycerol kinase family enzyme